MGYTKDMVHVTAAWSMHAPSNHTTNASRASTSDVTNCSWAYTRDHFPSMWDDQSVNPLLCFSSWNQSLCCSKRAMLLLTVMTQYIIVDFSPSVSQMSNVIYNCGNFYSICYSSAIFLTVWIYSYGHAYICIPIYTNPSRNI